MGDTADDRDFLPVAPTTQATVEARAPEGAPSMMGAISSRLGGPALQRKLRQRALQRKTEGHSAGSDSDEGDEDVHAHAEAGLSGAHGQLPHHEQIQKSFGRHDVGGIKAHVGGPAKDAAHAIGAVAYATGDSVAFESAPDVHTAAHEAAHVVQQREGVVSAKGGVGAAGDVYEQHADAVADRVVAGQSAEALLDEKSSGSGGGATTQRKAVQLMIGPGKPSGTRVSQGTKAGTITGVGTGASVGKYQVRWADGTVTVVAQSDYTVNVVGPPLPLVAPAKGTGAPSTPSTGSPTPSTPTPSTPTPTTATPSTPTPSTTTPPTTTAPTGVAPTTGQTPAITTPTPAPVVPAGPKLIAGLDAATPSTYDTGGGHSYADHGAHTTEQQQRTRLTSGVAPSGRASVVPGSAPGASKFASNDKHKQAFATALAELKSKNTGKKAFKGLTGPLPFADAGPIYTRDGKTAVATAVHVDMQKVDGSPDTFRLITMFPTK